MNRSFNKLKRNKTEFSVCLCSSHLNVFYHNTATVINQFPLLRNVATDLSKALHRTPSSSNMQNYKVTLLVSFMTSFFFPCASLTRILFLVCPHKLQSHCFVSGQLESLSFPPWCGLVSFSTVRLAVEAEGLVWPSLEVVDTVESRVLMLPDEDPLIVGHCQGKVTH